MICREGKHCVRADQMATPSACSSCALNPGWRRDTVIKRIMIEMRRNAAGDAVAGSVVAVVDHTGAWRGLGARLS